MGFKMKMALIFVSFLSNKHNFNMLSFETQWGSISKTPEDQKHSNARLFSGLNSDPVFNP